MTSQHSDGRNKPHSDTRACGVGLPGGDGAQVRAMTVEDISAKALELAAQARALGLTTVVHMLEVVALSAAAESVPEKWPDDAGR